MFDAVRQTGRLVLAVGLAAATLGIGAGDAAAATNPWADFPNCPVDNPLMLRVPAGTYSACLSMQPGLVNATVGQDALFVPSRPAVASAPAAEMQLGVADGATSERAVQATRGQTLVIARARLYRPDDPTDGCVNLFLVSQPEADCYALAQQSPLTSIFADVLLAGAPTGVDTQAMFTGTSPAITLPIKFHLIHPALGSSCYVGSDSTPVRATLTGGFFGNKQVTQDPNGYPVTITSGSFGLSPPYGTAISEPGATGCGPGGSLDAVVDAALGLPSHNDTFILFGTGHIAETTAGGQTLSDAWHAGTGV
jgi:hypothetical protein